MTKGTSAIANWLSQNGLLPVGSRSRGRTARGFCITTAARARGKVVYLLKITDIDFINAAGLTVRPGTGLYVGTYINRRLAENAGTQIMANKTTLVPAVWTSKNVSPVLMQLTLWGVAPTNVRNNKGRGFSCTKSKNGRWILSITDKELVDAVNPGKDSKYVGYYDSEKDAIAAGTALIKNKAAIMASAKSTATE